MDGNLEFFRFELILDDRRSQYANRTKDTVLPSMERWARRVLTRRHRGKILVQRLPIFEAHYDPGHMGTRVSYKVYYEVKDSDEAGAGAANDTAE